MYRRYPYITDLDPVPLANIYLDPGPVEFVPEQVPEKRPMFIAESQLQGDIQEGVYDSGYINTRPFDD